MIRYLLIMFFCGSSLVDGAETFSTIRVAIERDLSLEAVLTSVCKHEYHGTVNVFKTGKNSYSAVNSLDIEDFLLGVISREMDPNSPLEALKAQAVAARAHAIFQAAGSRDQPYDLVANIAQAYVGKPKLNKNIVLAIESTRGQVLDFHGKIIPAYFHSSCGGFTELISKVWPSRSASENAETDAFSSAVPCPYCPKAKENQWKYQTDLKALEKILRDAGYKTGKLVLVHVKDQSASGHILNLEFQGEKGSVKIQGEKLRELLGYSNLKSTLFSLQQDIKPDGTLGNVLQFKGLGYGHGVGLCQFGACAMAKAGASYQKILAYYYPQCKIR